MLRALILLAATAHLTTAEADDFVLDLDQAEMRRLASRLAVADLAVGEKGLVTYPTMCSEGTSLFIALRSSLSSERVDFAVPFETRREPDGRVAMTAAPSQKSTKTVDQAAADLLIGVRTCEDWHLTADQRLLVSSINGKTIASELMNALKP